MKIIVGNWKMNGNTEQKEIMLKALKNLKTKNKVILCLPFTLLAGNNHNIIIGAQDISNHQNGAYTGDISGQMLTATGVKYVIVGHSERRLYHDETNEIVKEKAQTAIQNKLIPIVCIGETAEEKKTGRTMPANKKMLLNSIPDRGDFIVAYEPRWAIGTGKTPKNADISAAIDTIIKALRGAKRENTPILYGGSVNADNASEILSLPHVDGLLVGGASLKVETFLPIINAAK